MFNNLSLNDYLKETSKISFPSPKGGSATALTGALAASLIQMIINVAENKTSTSTTNHELKNLKQHSLLIMQNLTNLIDEDALAYHQVIQTQKREKKQHVSRDHGNPLLSQKYLNATLTLCQIAQLNHELLGLIEKLDPLCPGSCRGDLEISHNLAQAALKSALAAIRANEDKITEENHRLILNETLEKLNIKKQKR